MRFPRRAVRSFGEPYRTGAMKQSLPRRRRRQIDSAAGSSGTISLRRAAEDGFRYVPTMPPSRRRTTTVAERGRPPSGQAEYRDGSRGSLRPLGDSPGC